MEAAIDTILGAAAAAGVAALDRLGLSEGRAVTVPVARKVLEQLEEKPDFTEEI